AGLDWRKPAQEVYNLVRGCDPQPGAFTTIKGEIVRFYGASLLDQPTTEAPGTILAIDEQGIQVAVDGGCLLVAKVKPDTGKKAAAAEFAADRGFKSGDKFEV
ncbi:MAG: hypothetical protein PVH56_09315, partial [Desulfobacterales bacterium]